MMEEKLDEILSHLSQLEKKVESIEQNQSKKWVLPVILILLTSAFGFVSYFLEKNVDKSNISESRKLEIFAEMEAEGQVGFYKEAHSKILHLDQSFREFCSFVVVDSVKINLGKLVGDFRFFCNNQQFIEPTLTNRLLEYSDFLARSIHGIGNPSASTTEKMGIYKKSEIYRDNSLRLVDLSLKKLSDI